MSVNIMGFELQLSGDPWELSYMISSATGGPPLAERTMHGRVWRAAPYIRVLHIWLGPFRLTRSIDEYMMIESEPSSHLFIPPPPPTGWPEPVGRRGWR